MKTGKWIFLLLTLLTPIFGALAEETTTTPAPAENQPVQSTEPAPTTAPPSDTTPYYEKDYDVKPDTFRPLNKTTGYLLGFSPVNGDGLIYTGHPVLGGLMIGTEVFAIPMIVVGAPSLGADNRNPFGAIGNGIGMFLFISGVALFTASYAVDAILTPVYVNKHNKALKSAEWKKFRPYFGATDKTIEGGVGFTF